MPPAAQQRCFLTGTQWQSASDDFQALTYSRNKTETTLTYRINCKMIETGKKLIDPNHKPTDQHFDL
jgi:hypothetical protein